MRKLGRVSVFLAAAIGMAICAQAEEKAKPARAAREKSAEKKTAKKDPSPAGEVVVKAIRVQETRSRDLVKPTGREPTASASLTVTLELEGKAVEAATHWGKVKIAEAADDRGTSLVVDPEKGGYFATDDLTELNRDMMWFFEDPKPRDRIRVEVQLTAAPREAKMIRKIEGSLRLAATEYQHVLVADLSKLVGKKLEDPALEAAGMAATLVELEPKGPTYVKLKGKKGDRLAEMQLVDGRGQKINTGSGSSSNGDDWEAELSGSDPLPADAKLDFVLVKDRRETEVPFRLGEIPLP